MPHLLDRIGIDERAENRAEEAQVGRRIVEHTAEDTAAPVEEGGRRVAERAGVGGEPVERRHHRGEDAHEEDRHLYEKYRKFALEEKSVHFLGRLANYRYFNMDAAILNALEYFDKHFSQ